MDNAAFISLHERLSGKARKLFARAITAHLETMITAAEMNGFRNLGSVLTRVEATELQKAFVSVYETVGTKLAKQTFKELTEGQKAQVFPDDAEAAWLNELRTTILYETIPARGAILTTSREIFEDYVNKALAEGTALEDVVKGLRSKFKDLMPWRAWNIARTEVLSAMNYGAEIGAEQTGLNIKKTWLAYIDKATRASHKAVHGTSAGSDGLFVVERTNEIGVDYMRFPGDPKASAGNRVNCYLPGNFIESNIVEAQRSFYSGKALEIITRGRQSITVTPNHNILTTNGFVSAQNIKIGDNLVCNSFSKYWFIRLIDHYIKQKVFRVENVFSALQKLWSSKKLMIAALDFDGDGQSMNGYVDIVYPKRKLRNGFISRKINSIREAIFNQTCLEGSIKCGFSPLEFFSRAYNSTTSRFMSFLHLAFPSCFRHFRPLSKLSLGLASEINAVRSKVPCHTMTGDAKFLRELIDTNSRNITFDDVINIREIDFSGHVYDFSSFNGVNIVNNIYTSNCRCTLVREVI